MPGENDKQVKLSFVVDQSSVQKAKQAMQDLISTAQRLAETLQRANIGGIGGGGMGTGTVHTGDVPTGPQSPERVLTTVAAQNPGNRVAAALSDNVRAIMSMAKAGGDAAKTLSETLKRSIADQERSIDGLQRKLTGLMDTFGKLNSTKMAAPGMEPSGEFASEISELHRRRADRLSRNIEDTAGELDTAHKSLEGLKDARKTLVDPKAPSGTGGGEGGAAAGGGGSFMDSVLKGGLTLGAIKMALNVGGQVTSMMGSGGEVWRSNLMAAQGKTWGSMYQGARAGDISTGYKALFLGGGLSGSAEPYNQILQGIKDAKTTDEWNTMLGDMSGVLGMDTTKFRDAAFNEQRTEALRGQAMKAVQENWEQSSGMPMLMNIQRFQSNVGTQMGLERQLGYGGKVVKNVNGKLMPSNFDELKEYTRNISRPESNPEWGNTEVSYYDPIHAEAQALAQKNVLIEEKASAAEQARTSGALSAIGRIAGAIGAGGAWSGAGGLAGQAAIGGASGSFLGGVMGMGGNAAAAMGMGGLAAAALGGAGVQTSGLGLLAAMQQGFGQTGDEGDMWNFREAQGGLQLMDGLLGGGIDQYQKTVNFVNAGSSFGGGDMSRQQYLADVFGKDPNLMADILSGNPNAATKAWMEAHGVTKEGAQSFMTQSSASLIGRAAAQETGSDPGQRAILAIQNEAGGDIGKYMQIHNIKKGTKEARKLANLVGAGGAESGISDDAGWAGFLKIETGFGSTLKQGGEGAVPSASRNEALRQQAQQAKQDQDKIDTNMGLIKTAADALQPAVVAFGGAVTEVEANAEDLADALEWLARRVLKAGGSSDDTVDEFLKKSHQKRADAKASASLPRTPTKNNSNGFPGPGD